MRKCGKLVTRFLAFILVAVMIMSTFSVVPAIAAAPLSKQLTLYLVPNTHLDTAWQHPFPQVANNTSYGIRPMFRNSTSALSQGDYRFTTSASAHLKMLKDYYNDDNPTEADRLWTLTQQLVDQEKLDLAGGQITEPDLNIPSGEALVRQSLYAQHFFEANFTRKGGRYVALTGMVPDVFGFSGQLPQILFKSEMKYFVTSKVNWNTQEGGGNAIGSSFEHYRTASAGRDSDIMTWQALDGKSTVLAYFLYNDYNNTNPAGSIQSIFDRNWYTTTGNDGFGISNTVNFHGGVRNTQIRTAVAFYGGGDFGQGMNSGLSSTDGNSFRHHESVAASTNGALINVKTSTITQFFQETEANEDLSRLNTTNGNYIDGEMYAEFHRGTYTSWARLKKYNRSNEILGESAEKAATIGFYTNSLTTNSQQRIEDGWYKILINQMHDVLPGSALAWQYYLTFNHEELAANLFNGVRDNALAALAYRADTNVVGKPVFVYNDLSWARSGEVTVSLKYDTLPPNNQVVVYDGTTAINPTKVVANTEKSRLNVTFMATDIPAIGYKVFDVRAEAPVAKATPLSFDQATWTISNANLKVKFNPNSGYISSLQTIVNGAWKEMFAQGVGTEGGELHVYRDCDENRPDQNFDQWNVNTADLNKEPDYIFDNKPLSMKVTSNTPEKVTVSVAKEWGGSVVTQDFTVYADSDRVDVHLAADWYQTKRLLKVSFPIAADNNYANFETSFGTVRRPTNRINENGTANIFGRERFEVPMHKWSDVTDKSGAYGVSILNDAKYGNDVLRKVMSNGTTFVRSRITVARTPRAQAWAGNSSYPPVQPYVFDSTRHEFNYAIAPHAGSWEDARTVNKAHELNYPMAAFEAVKGASNGLSRAESFASSDKPNVIISALKNQYDTPEARNTVIVRVYESSGRDTNDVTITLPGNIVAGSAKEVNMLEHDYDAIHGYNTSDAKNPNAYALKPLTVSGKTVKFDIGKYEILTIQVELVPSSLSLLTVPQESVTLAYNSRGVTDNTNRRAGFLEGTGASTSNSGRSMPQEHWPVGNKINYQGIEFSLGAPNANNFLNGTSTANTITVTPARGYSKLYIVGAAVATSGGSVNNNSPYSRDPATGTFTVNYTSGDPTAKAITLNSWRTELSGWNRTAFMDDQPYVYDSVAHFNGHYHTSTGSSNSSEMYESDNYLFVYAIDIDESRTVSSIQIPVSSNIKIAAMTLADPADGFGKVYDSADADPWEFSAPTPSVVQNVKAEYDASSDYNDFFITWDPADNAVQYKLHYGTAANFTPSSSNLVTTTGTLSYTHASPSLTSAQILAGTTKLFYKVVAVGRAANDAAASAASNGLAPRFVNYSLGLTAATRVVANHEANTSSERARDGVDGSVSTKWCATRGGTTGSISASNPAWLAVDLTGSDGVTVQIDRIEIYHCGAGGEQASANTRDFNVKVSTDTTNCMTTTATSPNGTWSTIVNVSGNLGTSAGNVTTHTVNAKTRFVRLYITNPEVTAWSGAARIYEFKVFGTNPDFVTPPPASTANNARIIQTPTLTADGKFGEMYMEVEYDFYNQDSTVTEDVAKTEFKWSKKLKDNYREYYVTLPGSYKGIFQNAEVGGSYKCDISVWDSTGRKGSTIAADTEVSTAVNVLRSPSVATVLSQTTAAASGPAARLIDGTNGSSNKWDVTTTGTSPGPCPHNAVFDMGSVRSFNVFKVYHANSYATAGSYDADTALNTFDFDLSYSLDNVNWTTKEIRANRDPITTVNLGGAVQARYIMITVLTPSGYAIGEGTNTTELTYLSIRIGELEALYDESLLLGLRPPAVLYEGSNMVGLTAAKGKTVSVKSRFYSNPTREGNISVFAAAYNENGAMISVKQNVASFSTIGLFESTIADFVVPVNAASLKVFYWSDGIMVPVSEDVVIK